MHAQIAGSVLVEVEAAGHLALLECPEEVNQALDDLLTRVAAVRSQGRAG